MRYVKRFIVIEKPLIHSTGYYYVLHDNKHELEDILFDSSDDCENVCEMLNKQYREILWLRNKYGYINNIEKTYSEKILRK